MVPTYLFWSVHGIVFRTALTNVLLFRGEALFTSEKNKKPKGEVIRRNSLMWGSYRGVNTDFYLSTLMSV